jgi:hypothetical protein
MVELIIFLIQSVAIFTSGVFVAQAAERNAREIRRKKREDDEYRRFNP